MVKFIAERDHRTFVDDQGVTIHYYVWAPGRPKAVVQIAHGVGEHALRYEALAQELVNPGTPSMPTTTAATAATGVEMSDGDLTEDRQARARRPARDAAEPPRPRHDHPTRARRAAARAHGPLLGLAHGAEPAQRPGRQPWDAVVLTRHAPPHARAA